VNGRADVHVALRIVELSEESVLENIHFVDVELVPEPGTVICHVTDFQGVVRGKFALHTGRPRLNHRGCNVGIVSVYRCVRSLQQRKRRRKRRWSLLHVVQGSSRTENYRSGDEQALRGTIHNIGSGRLTTKITGITTRYGRKAVQALTAISDIVSGAEYRLSRVSQHPVQSGHVRVGLPSEADRRSKRLQIRIVPALAFVGDVGRGRRTIFAPGVKEIARTRDAKKARCAAGDHRVFVQAVTRRTRVFPAQTVSEGQIGSYAPAVRGVKSDFVLPILVYSRRASEKAIIRRAEVNVG